MDRGYSVGNSSDSGYSVGNSSTESGVRVHSMVDSGVHVGVHAGVHVGVDRGNSSYMTGSRSGDGVVGVVDRNSAGHSVDRDSIIDSSYIVDSTVSNSTDTRDYTVTMSTPVMIPPFVKP